MKAWEHFLALQEADLGTETTTKWLRSLKILKFDACNVYIEAKDAFHAAWFEEHMRPKLASLLLNNNGRRVRVHLSIAGSRPPGEAYASAHGSRRRTWETGAKEPAEPAPFALTFDSLDPLAHFKAFVAGEGTQLAYKLLCEITGQASASQLQEAAKPLLTTFNPVYLHGPSGTGKTHLMMAAAHQLRERGFNVLYARAETFTQHVVYAIRSGQMPLFRQAYRNTDVLLVDDVHLFSRKGATQEEFFHTFNTLHVAGKQIVLSANCAPQELQLIEPRLVSRFEWGIVVPLDPPQPQELYQILERKAKALGFVLNEKVIQFLVESFPRLKSVVRSLEALALRYHLHEQEIRLPKGVMTVALARTLLEDLIQEEQKVAVTPRHILEVVAEHFGIKVEDILSKGQSRECVVPRQIAMYLCRKQLKMPYMQIGDLCKRDHSTVMTSVKQVQREVDLNHPDITGSLKSILKRLAS